MMRLRQLLVASCALFALVWSCAACGEGDKAETTDPGATTTDTGEVAQDESGTGPSALDEGTEPVSDPGTETPVADDGEEDVQKAIDEGRLVFDAEAFPACEEKLVALVSECPNNGLFNARVLDLWRECHKTALVGQVDDEGTCSAHYECKSGYCEFVVGGENTCKGASDWPICEDGAACGSSTDCVCKTGQFCHGASDEEKTCTPLLGEGEDCSDDPGVCEGQCDSYDTETCQSYCDGRE